MKWVRPEVCEEEKRKRDFDGDTWKEKRSMEFLRANGDGIKMDVTAMELKGPISFGTRTDIAQERDWYRSGQGLISLRTRTYIAQGRDWYRSG
jgi:hypothetical protein